MENVKRKEQKRIEMGRKEERENGEKVERRREKNRLELRQTN